VLVVVDAKALLTFKTPPIFAFLRIPIPPFVVIDPDHGVVDGVESETVNGLRITKGVPIVFESI